MNKKLQVCEKCKQNSIIWKTKDKKKYCAKCANILFPPLKTKKEIKKVKSISKLKTELDTIFSQFIRLRDSDSNGYCTCSTCGSNLFWKEIQAGHFQSRRFLGIRWDEQNVHAQCVKCNVYNHGEQFLMSLYIDRKYAPGTSDRLFVEARKSFKMNRSWMEERIQYYKQKVDELKKNKNL